MPPCQDTTKDSLLSVALRVHSKQKAQKIRSLDLKPTLHFIANKPKPTAKS